MNGLRCLAAAVVLVAWPLSIAGKKTDGGDLVAPRVIRGAQPYAQFGDPIERLLAAQK